MTRYALDAGRTIEVERGRKVTLRLEANRTEGYRWSVAASGNALAQIDKPAAKVLNYTVSVRQ